MTKSYTRGAHRFRTRAPWITLRLTGWALVAVTVMSLFITACGSGTGSNEAPTQTPGVHSTPTPPPSPTATEVAAGKTPTATETTATRTPGTTTGETTAFNVYFIKDEKIATAHRVVPQTRQVGAAAVRALLEGTTEAEKQAGMSTAVPEGTVFLDLSISDGTATVDLSSEYESGGGSFAMRARLAQVVFTLTQFPTVDDVRFRIDGQPVDVFGSEGIALDNPVSRADYEDLSPAILIEHPAIGDAINSPARISGTANTFEAVFQIRIVDQTGTPIVDQQFVQATSGSGTRGTFDISLPFSVSEPTPAEIVAWEYSAKDGSVINTVTVPVTLQP